MYSCFEKLFISLIFLKCFLLPVYSTDPCEPSGSNDPLTAAVPVPDQGATEDPRMHVTSVQLVDGEDTSWFNDIKGHVRAGYDHLRTTYGYEPLKVNTAAARFGFLIQEEGKPPVLLFPDHPLNDPKLCFTSKFKKHGETPGFKFYSLRNSFDHPETFQTALSNVMSMIIRNFSLSDEDLNREIEESRKQIKIAEQRIEKNRKIIERCKENIEKATRTIKQDIGAFLWETMEYEEKLMINQNPFGWLSNKISYYQSRISFLADNIFHSERFQAIDSDEWERRFFHSEQASHFYFWSYFKTPSNLSSFVDSIFSKNFKKNTRVDIIVDICTHLAMCSNCAFTYHFENIAKLHYLRYITQYLQQHKNLKVDSILIIRVSSLLPYEGDPLPDPVDKWDQTKVGHLTPADL